MMQQLIERYKRLRTKRYLSRTCQYSYAFVGMGQHSLNNLYPVLHYLGVPLKYICVTSKQKARLIERRFPHVVATTSMDDILRDDTIKGVFVSASPEAHFYIASRILQSGKSLFVEKPPCQTLKQLDALIDLQRLHGSPVAMAGLQKQHAPAVQILRQRLNKEHLINYDFHYLTGAYPEGDVILDLYIHPLALVCCLFGKPEILACPRIAPSSYLIMLRHPHVVGTLELSTACTWSDAEESIKVCTTRGTYHLSQMEELICLAHPSAFMGLPIEKVRSRNKTIEYLFGRNNFIPTLPNNQICSQGYFSELQDFVDAVEGRRDCVDSSLQSLRDVYGLLDSLKTSEHCRY